VRSVLTDSRPLEQLLRAADATTASILERSLAGTAPTVEEGAHLLRCEGESLTALIRTADRVRATDVGEEVTYVINPNITFTNVCLVGCPFCAFARHRKDADARTDSNEELLAKVQDALDRGATEVCMQGGINPEMEAFGYRDLLLAIKARYPQIHIHAFSP